MIETTTHAPSFMYYDTRVIVYPRMILIMTIPHGKSKFSY